jgi:(E)-4-hydroxy-3-methylbut-2-enyl-diphosphate synthase
VDGKPDHKMDNEHMIDHVVALVEARAAEIEAAKSALQMAPAAE